MVKISVIVLANGNENGLNKCVDSVLKQSYKDYELIVMCRQQNDELINKFQNNFQVKIHIDETKNINILRKEAIEQAKGEYFTFIDPRDFLIDESALEKLINLSSEKKSNLIISSYMLLKQGRFLYKNVDTEIISYNRFRAFQLSENEFRSLDGALIKRNLFEKINDYNSPSQLLLTSLAEGAQNILYAGLNAYVYVEENNEDRNEELIWGKGNEFHFSNTYSIVEKNRIEQYKPNIPSAIEVALCIDDNVMDYMETLIYSIYKNTSSYVNVNIIYKKLSDESLDKLAWIDGKMSTVNVRPVQISEELHKSMEKISLGHDMWNLPISSYYRIFLADILPDVDRIIYLDADTLLTGDLTELWRTDLEGNFLAACLDERAYMKKVFSVLNPRRREYFNSGVLVFDLCLFRKYKTINDFLDFLVDTADLYELGDQDALNLYFLDAVKLLDSSWNYGVPSYKEYGQINNINLLHFYGKAKPLRSFYDYVSDDKIREFVRLYRKYYHEAAELTEYKNSNSKISIIITAHSADDDFFKSLERLSYQMYPNKEIIILDATEDNKLRDKIKPIVNNLQYIEYYNCNGRDVAEVKKFAVSRSTGDHLYFLDSPNYIDKNFILGELNEIMVKNEADMVTTTMMIYHPSENSLTGYGTDDKEIDVSSESIEDLQSRYLGNDYNMLTGHLFDKKLFNNLEELNFADEKKLMAEILYRAKKRIRKNSYDWVKVIS
ncbi:glycosyltransferase [Ligilactobacillus salivarius]|uniref:glycosyltransferase n=1 Tax=Ligilactobacillus salivarius TaxID=1624 RepID=UPI00339C4309